MDFPGVPPEPLLVLYTHHAVVPAGDEALWRPPPCEPLTRQGAIYGRGTADSKANLVSIIGALRAHGGRPPVGVKVVLEGQEDRGRPFDHFPPRDPGRFQATADDLALRFTPSGS